jgi:hypothetical protein
MGKPANYCGVTGKPCEHRTHMATSSDCAECRYMFLLNAIENLRKEIRKNGK